MGEQTKKIQKMYYSGTINSREFWKQVTNFFGLTHVSEIELRNAYLTSYTIFPEMLELAIILKQKYKTLLLSNLTVEMVAEIETKYSIKKYFHTLYFQMKLV